MAHFHSFLCLISVCGDPKVLFLLLPVELWPGGIFWPPSNLWMGSSPLKLSALNSTVISLEVPTGDSSLTSASRGAWPGKETPLSTEVFNTCVLSFMGEKAIPQHPQHFLSRTCPSSVLHFPQAHLSLPSLSCLSMESRNNHLWVGSVQFPLKPYLLQKCIWVVAEVPASQEMSNHPQGSEYDYFLPSHTFAEQNLPAEDDQKGTQQLFLSPHSYYSFLLLTKLTTRKPLLQEGTWKFWRQAHFWPVIWGAANVCSCAGLILSEQGWRIRWPQLGLEPLYFGKG